MTTDVPRGEGKSGDPEDAKGEVCGPNCEERECGTDGCNGSCGDCALVLETCSDEGQCVPHLCESTKDCPSNLVCAKEAGRCVVCVGDEDCEEDETCGADYECHSFVPCGSDKDCKDYDLICDKDAGQCVECLESVDCEPDEYCLEKYCVPDVCAAGESHCDGQEVLTCDDEGSGRAITATCNDGQYCEGGACHDEVCPPAAIYCDGDLLKTCGPDGKEVVAEENCAQQEMVCKMGECVPLACEPSSAWCVDDFVQGVCTDDGMAASETPCPAEHYCEDGACSPWNCLAGQEYCEGEVLKTCDEKGKGLLSVEDCAEAGQHCFGDECIDTLCEPEAKFCEDDVTKATCADDGMDVQAEVCPAEHYCDVGECFGWLCPPGEAFCLDDVAKVCNGMGSGVQSQVNCSASGKLCVEGACKDQVCEPGTSSCNGSEVDQCDATGTVVSVVDTCSDDQYCAQSADSATCEDQVCEPTTTGCAGTQVTQCNAQGSSFSVLEDCADDQKGCAEGVCVEQVCTPNTWYCDGLSVMQCDETGLNPQVEEACIEGQYCAEDGQGAQCEDQICTPGVLSCDGTKVMLCDELGAALSEVEDCAADGMQCDEGQCMQQQVCGDGALAEDEECDDADNVLCDGCEECENRSSLHLAQFGAHAESTSLPTSFGALTYELWFRIDGVGYDSCHLADNTHFLLSHRSGGDDSGKGAFVRIESGILHAYYDTGAGAATLVGPQVGQGWHHVALAMGNGAANLFVDGAEIATASIGSGAVGAATHFRVGMESPCIGCSACYNDLGKSKGWVDELRISDAIRYGGPFVPARRVQADSNTVGLWHFDEDSGTAATDASGNGYSLTLLGAAEWVPDDCYGSSPDSAACGDGQQAVWEECDDGNAASGDGCSADCQQEP